MSYHYSFGNVATNAGNQVVSATKAVGSGIVNAATAPSRAVQSLEDAANSATAAANAAGMKADNAVALIRESKKKLEQAKKTLEQYQLTQAHWDKLAQLEAKFNQTLAMLPLTSRIALIQEYERTVDILFILAVTGLLGSTFLLWFFFGRDRSKVMKKKPKPSKKEP